MEKYLHFYVFNHYIVGLVSDKWLFDVVGSFPAFCFIKKPHTYLEVVTKRKIKKTTEMWWVPY